MPLNLNSRAEEIHIISVATHLLVELSTNPTFVTTPFFEYAVALSHNLSNSYLLAGPENEQAMALKVLGEQEGHTRFLCSCGCIHY